MTFLTWEEPLRLLKEGVGPATSTQLALAELVALRLRGNEPRNVVAVMIEDFLKPKIWGNESEVASTKQLAFLVDLGSDDVSDMRLTKPVASAWIQYYLATQNIQKLQDLKLISGDAVIRRTAWQDPVGGLPTESLEFFRVSSISPDGLVFFKGGNGQCSWPRSLRRANIDEDPRSYPLFRHVSTFDD